MTVIVSAAATQSHKLLEYLYIVLTAKKVIPQGLSLYWTTIVFLFLFFFSSFAVIGYSYLADNPCLWLFRTKAS